MKIKNLTDVDRCLRGVDFPAGKAVEVDEPMLIEKCLAMPTFEQVKPGRKAKNDKKSV